jgi:hypothetical protein
MNESSWTCLPVCLSRPISLPIVLVLDSHMFVVCNLCTYLHSFRTRHVFVRQIAYYKSGVAAGGSEKARFFINIA